MTAYGRAVHESPEGRFVVELQSVNRKHLELRPSLPPELTRFEPDLKTWLSDEISRGLVTVRVTASYDQLAPASLSPNLPLARQAKAAWDQIAQDLGVGNEAGFQLAMLKDIPGILDQGDELSDEEAYRSALEAAVKAALSPFIAMREREGSTLAKEFTRRIQNTRNQLAEIRRLAPGATDKLREKLRKRLEELLPQTREGDDRLLREIALYAERADISEEIERLESHLAQFSDGMERGGPCGKRLDFLCQEMMREANTICSKSVDITMTQSAVEMKAELERIREQLQNVE